MRLLIVAIALLLSGCGSPDGPASIRLINRSQVSLEDVVVKFPSVTEDYGTIAPGQATSYRTVDRAYRYAYVEATIQGQPAVLQPHDFVGESLLGPGHYAYALTYNNAAKSKYDRMRLELIRE